MRQSHVLSWLTPSHQHRVLQTRHQRTVAQGRLRNNCKIACSSHRSGCNSSLPLSLPHPSFIQQRNLWVLHTPLQARYQASATFHWHLWYPEEVLRRESRTGRVFLDWAAAAREARVTVESQWTKNKTNMSMKPTSVLRPSLHNYTSYLICEFQIIC